MDEFIKRYKIRRIHISIYHPQANGMVERGYKLIINTLFKIINGDLEN